jgi:DNA-binding CsgD family transcriptional regulator
MKRLSSDIGKELEECKREICILRQSLEEKENRLKNFENLIKDLDALVFSTYFVSPAELCIKHPEYYLKLLGYNKEEKQDFDFKDFIKCLHPVDTEAFSRIMDILYNKREKCFSGIFRMRHREGNYLWMYGHIMFSGTDEMTGNASVKGIIKVFCPKFYANQQIEALNKELLRLKTKDLSHMLTLHELTIARYIADGMQHDDITKKLNISLSTLKTIKSIMFDKTGSKNSPNLVKFLYTHGLYD